MKHIIALLLYFIPSIAFSATHEIDHSHSYIQFKGEHAGDAFTGKFETWSGEITFDENDLENASIHVTIDTASAKTGNKMYDGTLPQADWFAVKQHPKATFKSTAISKADDTFSVEGVLTLRSIEKPVTFDFTLMPAEHDETSQHGHAELIIKRLDFDIGKASDKLAEWVSNEIALTLHMIVKPLP